MSQFKVSFLNFEVSDQSFEVAGACMNRFDCKSAHTQFEIQMFSDTDVIYV